MSKKYFTILLFVKKPLNYILTATYAKPLSEWNIPLECQSYWDIEDEQLCKKQNIQD